MMTDPKDEHAAHRSGNGRDHPFEKQGDRHADKHADKLREALFRRVFSALKANDEYQPDMTNMGLIRQLHHAEHVFSTAYDEFLKPYNLTSAKYRLLTWLMACDKVGFSDGLLPSQLSFVQAISPNTVTVLLHGLQDQGLIRRARHPVDHRKHIITITDSGRELLRHLLPLYFGYIESSVSALTVEERVMLTNLLDKLINSAEQAQFNQAKLITSATSAGDRDEPQTGYGFGERDSLDDESID